MSTNTKVQKLEILSGSNHFTMTAITGTTPTAIVEPIGSIIRSSDGRVWRSAGTGSWEILGKASMNLWDYPLSPNRYDDEFEAPVLSPDWIVAGSGTPITYGLSPYTQFTTGSTRVDMQMRKSWATLQPAASAASTVFVKKVDAAMGDFLVWGRFSCAKRANTLSVSDGQVGLLIGDSSSLDGANPKIADFVSVIIQDPTTTAINLMSFFKSQGGVVSGISSGEDLFVTKNTAQPFSTVGIQKIGTTYHAWAFDAGGGRMWLSGTVWTGSLNYVGFYVLNTSNAQPGNLLHGVDFIRVVTGSSWLP